MYQTLILIGNLGKDPELRYTPGGTAVGEFGLAMSRRFRDKNTNDWREDVCFVDVTAWGRTGEVCCEYLAKGRPVFVEGRLQLDTWEGQDGKKRSKLRVVADNVQFLERRGGDRDGGGEGGSSPRRAASPKPAKPAGQSEEPAIDEDVPF